ncbi:tyrosine-type recombinase/integrase [Viridibacillus arvi]|uniref:tyrosine-type recombinase/integrase n=1 Tax=Viridibacillus arvi TaxID=263475 RepID=UPI0034CE3898
MTATVSQLVPFNENQLVISKVYESFLKSNARNSTRTAEEYKGRVEEFFFMTLKKPIEYITLEEINSIKHSDVKMYVSDLTERGNTDKTISTKLYTVTSFYNELLKNDLQVNPTIFKVKLKIQEKHHEALSFEELNSLYDFLINEEKELGLEKYLLLKTLFTTGNRKSATFNMTWKDSFSRKTDIETGKKVWIVTVLDKGKKVVEKPIPDEFYEELQQLSKGQDKVFALSTKTVERALERFSKKIGRNITMHSMKATGVTIGYQLTKDINLCKQYASHEDISTTAIYLKEESSYVKQLSYNMSREVDESKLTNMSREDLIDFLMDDRNKDIKNSILLRLG